MSDWVHDSLTDTISCLRNVGMIDLAADMERLLASGDVENLRIYRKSEIEPLADAVSSIEDETELAGLLRRLTKVLSLRHATIHVVRETGNVTFEPKVVTTYPKAWIERYVDRNYAKIDPIFPLANQMDSGFYWDTLDRTSPIVDAFFKDAQTAGVGRSGFTHPVRIWQSVKVAVSVTSDLEPREFREMFAPFRSDLEYLAEDLVLAFCELAAQEFPPERTPPDQLLRLLYGLAQGRTMRELAAEYGLKDIEAESQEICNFYESRTLLQAVMKCVRLNHLEDMTLNKWQITSEAEDA